MRLLQFGGVVLPQLNGSFNSPVSFRSSVIALQNGGFDQDGSNSYLESRVLTYSFYVSTAEAAITSIDQLIEDLYEEAGKGVRRLMAVKRDGTVVTALCKLVQASVNVDSRLWANSALPTVEGYDTMQMALELSYPYWLAVEDETKLLDAGWLADGSFTFAISSATQTVTLDSGTLSDDISIANTGNIAHERLVITITGGAGLVSTGDLLIVNNTTGEQIGWTGSLADGDVLLIQTLPQTIVLNGSTAYVDTVLPAGQIPFLSVPLGTISITVSFVSITGGDVEISIEHARHYIR